MNRVISRLSDSPEEPVRPRVLGAVLFWGAPAARNLALLLSLPDKAVRLRREQCLKGGFDEGGKTFYRPASRRLWRRMLLILMTLD
jgi:hypothetical protein